MNFDDIPTPETDATDNRQTSRSSGAAYLNMRHQSRILERHLTVEKNRAEEMGKLAHAAACESADLRRERDRFRYALDQIGFYLATALSTESERLTVALDALHKLLALKPEYENPSKFYFTMRDIAREGVLGKR